ncbi:sensor histidine kinase [Phenylobacterium terrae]|uniref:histidine kinase n=1 Tax=Phenylobacterium terrae TaxID=2665495 RepID=A0ABW4N4N9_9CAUL
MIENFEADAAAPSPRLDFEALFGALPSPYMVLDRQLNYVAVNDAYVEATGRSREGLIGGAIFDLFPNDGESGALLRASFERVLKTGRPDSIAYIPYPIAAPTGALEMRYWSAVHTPLKDAQGKVAFIVQNTVDVTELRRLKDIAYGPAGQPRASAAQLLLRAQEVQAANASLIDETNQLRDLFMQAPGFMAVLTGRDLTFQFVNSAYLQLIGHRQVIGRTVLEALPEVRAQGFVELLSDVMSTRQPYVGRAMGVRLQRTPDGPPQERFVDFIYQPILDPAGEATGVFVEGYDVTDRVRAEAQQKLLVDELNHRVKNTLATVQAIAAHTLRGYPDPKGFREQFESRLMALSGTHDLLTATSWRSACLKDVLLAELKPHGEGRYELDGADVNLSPNEALTLGLVFHELATNAAKYGALSAPGGKVRVAWRVTRECGQPRLALTWTEAGGPPVDPPKRKGFGSRLIERTLRGDIQGGASLDFAPSGLTCRLEAPLRAAD